MSGARRISSRWWVALMVLATTWALAALWVVPSLIRQAYAGESIAFLNGLISGRSQHDVQFYLAVWGEMALRLTILFAAGAGAVLIGLLNRDRIRALARRALAHLPELRARDVGMLALWFGMVGGLAEAAGMVFRYRIQNRPTGEVYWGEVWWMAPLGASLGLLLVGLAVIIVRRGLRLERRFLGLAPFLFAATIVYSLVGSLQLGVHELALAILAAGVGVQVARSIAGRTESWLRTGRRVVAVGVSLLLLWSLFLPRWRSRVEANRLAELPAPSAEAPNVLLIVWDTVRSFSLSLYGYERQTTPVLDEFAESGVVFDRAIATSPWTLPSHGSLFTGRYHHELSVDWLEPLDDTYPTLAEVLAGRGYATAGFVGNTYYAGEGFGLGRGFLWYDDRLPPSPESVAESWGLSRSLLTRIRTLLDNRQRALRKPAGHVNSAFLEWLDRRDESRPFFAFLNFFDAHDPYLPPEPFNLRFSDVQPRYWLDWYAEYDPGELEELRDAYDSAIFYVDHALGRLLDALEARGLRENTVIVLTSDHGEELGEHGAPLVGHGRSLYLPVLRIPLVISFPPRVEQGSRRDELVSLRDAPGTIMELIGTDPSSHPFPGNSLVPYLAGQVDAPGSKASPALSEVTRMVDVEEWFEWPAASGSLRSVVSGNAHYIVHEDGTEHLFDVAADPWEREDLATLPREPHSLMPLAHYRRLLEELAPAGSSDRSASR